MIVYDSGKTFGRKIIAVWAWREGDMIYYDPITPSGYMSWIQENPHLIPFIKSMQRGPTHE